MTPLDPDSREYRALVLSGRLSAFMEVGDQFAAMNDRLDAADENEEIPALIESWRSLSDFLVSTAAEIRTELELLKAEKP